MLTPRQWTWLNNGSFTGIRRPCVDVAPYRRFGDPCVTGHGLRSRMIADMWWAGMWTLADFDREYDMTRDDVLVACWFEARYGTRATRARWKAWHDGPAAELWYCARWDFVPMPPQKPSSATAVAERSIA